MTSPAEADRSEAAGRRRRLASAALLGGLGLLPAVAGTPDVVAELSWLALIAVGVGYGCGAARVPLAEACIVPGGWALFLAYAAARSERVVPYPLYGLLACAGLFAAGTALGRLVGRAPLAGAGVCTFLVLALSGLAVQGGFPTDSPARDAWARTHPRLARASLELSPLVLVLESAGWDVTHAHPRFYASSGVEWFPRRPWQGRLAAPASLVVGSLLAAVAAGIRRSHPVHRPRDAD